MRATTSSFHAGTWVTLKKPPRQIRTLTFGKKYMVHQSAYPQTMGWRVNLEDDLGRVRSFSSGFFKLWEESPEPPMPEAA